MSSSDCKNCLDGICTCGYAYKDFSDDKLVDFLSGLLQYHDLKSLSKEMERRTYLRSDIFYPTLKLIKNMKKEK